MEFLDTNILIYAVSHRLEDAEKAEIARRLMKPRAQAISLQVLQEFYNAARQPKKLALDHTVAAAYCQRWRRFTVLEPTLALFDDALALCKRFHVSYYDAAILAAALILKCKVVYSEDLNDGQNYRGVKVVNPFRGL